MPHSGCRLCVDPAGSRAKRFLRTANKTHRRARRGSAEQLKGRPPDDRVPWPLCVLGVLCGYSLIARLRKKHAPTLVRFLQVWAASRRAAGRETKKLPPAGSAKTNTYVGFLRHPRPQMSASPQQRGPSPHLPGSNPDRSHLARPERTEQQRFSGWSQREWRVLVTVLSQLNNLAVGAGGLSEGCAA